MIHFEIESTQDPMTQSTQPQYEVQVQEPIVPVQTEEEKKKALAVEALAFIKRAKIEVKRQEPEEKKVSAPVKISLGLAKKQKEPVVTEKPKPKPKQVPVPEPEISKSAESLPSTPEQQQPVKQRATRTRKEFELAPNDNFARQFSHLVRIECYNCGEVIPKPEEIQVSLYRVNEEGTIVSLTHICTKCVDEDLECNWLKYEPVPITKGSNARSLYAQRKFPKMTTKHVLTYHGNDEQDVWRILTFLRNIRDEDTEKNLSLKKKKPLFSLPKFFYLPIWNIYSPNMTDLISSLGVDPRLGDAYNNMNDFVSGRMRLFQNIIPLEEEKEKTQEKPQNEQESEDEQSQKEFVLEDEEEGELNE